MADGSPVKGWCPGALKPMRSGDGLVVRVRTGPIVAPMLAHALADLARTHGNGQIDLTQRANLQLRGITDDSWPAVIAALEALDVLDDDAGVEAVRNIILSPLAGLDPTAHFDGIAAFQALNTRILADPVFRQLPGKFGFLIDDGGRLPLHDVGTDVHFRGTDMSVIVEIGGRLPLATISAEAIPDVASRLAAVFVAQKHENRRLLLLAEQIGTAAIAHAAGLEPDGSIASDRRGAPDHIGLLDIGATPLRGIGIPFGRLTASMLDCLATCADEIRLTPWRTVILAGRKANPAALPEADFILSAQDPRLSVTACPGLPDCESAARDIRPDALRLAPLAARLPGNGVRLHVSGCAKGCARPQTTDVTLVARANGYDLIENGRTSDHPVSTGLALGPIEAYLDAKAAHKLPRTRSVTPPVKPVSDRNSYIRNGAEIYRHSFAIIRSEADLARFTPDEEPVAVRIIHACGMVEVASDIRFSPGAAAAAKAALRAGAPIFTDAEMVARGVTRARLPADNEVICTLTDPRVAAVAEATGNTRSAAAMDLWRDRLGGAVVSIGNAPTSLYRLLEMLDEGAPMPACVIGMPVGFVGAAESKDALIADGRVPFIVVTGRKGGSAMAAAAVNALASDRE
jgi:precorrin-8X/cobalt-precorrin-8 methylmutase